MLKNGQKNSIHNIKAVLVFFKLLSSYCGSVLRKIRGDRRRTKTKLNSFETNPDFQTIPYLNLISNQIHRLTEIIVHMKNKKKTSHQLVDGNE